jgi:hypothetical protein
MDANRETPSAAALNRWEEKPADASGADGEARAGLREHGGGERGWEPDWDGWLAEKAARRAAQSGGHGSALSLGGLGGGGSSERWLVCHQCAFGGQLNLVLPSFGNGAVAAPFGDSGLTASERLRGCGLRSVVREKFLRAHGPQLSEF